MRKPSSTESASALIDERIKELGDWRGTMLAKVREIIHEADPEIVEEWKWMGTPTFSHCGIVCTGETYKKVVKMTFAKGASLEDPPPSRTCLNKLVQCFPCCGGRHNFSERFRLDG